ncbi:MAG: hypothetical protein HZA18_01420 [Nitrospirae bacterium]|nr:hypothetical protein [Nitrospirota bacterium]
MNLYPFLFLLLLLIQSCSSSNGSNAEPLWTVMVYMAGDNNLSGALLNDLGELEAVGSTGLVNVVVQMDTLGGTTKRILVERGQSILLEDLGEQNMADPQTLKDFLLWAKTDYPALRYALILSSHGDGLAKRLPYHPTDRILGRILQDDTDGVRCCLSNTLVRQALEDAGIYLDLLGFDASQMGQIETAYEFRNLSDILVFSQETGQAHGWDYTAILRALRSKPLMGGRELARVIVDSYKSFYEEVFYPENPDVEQYLTISAIQLKNSMNDMAVEINRLSEGMNGILTGDQTGTGAALLNAVSEARNLTQELNPLTAPYVYVDLMDLISNLKDALNRYSDLSGQLQEVKDSAGRILSMKKDIIIAEYHGKDRPKANGLSITFFRLPEALQYQQYYEISSLFDPYTGEGSQVQFFHDTHWDEFLQTYYQKAGLLGPS